MPTHCFHSVIRLFLLGLVLITLPHSVSAQPEDPAQNAPALDDASDHEQYEDEIQDLNQSIDPSNQVDLGELFKSFPGRWSGEGRMYSKGGKLDTVKCRATYFLSKDGTELKQNLRCASAAGKIEVKSVIHQDGETISGTWHETIYELKGELSGRSLKNGLLVHVKGQWMQATMQLLFLKGKQIAEIQFNHSTLVGLTLVLKKG